MRALVMTIIAASSGCDSSGDHCDSSTASYECRQQCGLAQCQFDPVCDNGRWMFICAQLRQCSQPGPCHRPDDTTMLCATDRTFPVESGECCQCVVPDNPQIGDGKWVCETVTETTLATTCEPFLDLAVSAPSDAAEHITDGGTD